MTSYPQHPRPSEIVTHDGRLYHLGFTPEEVAPHLILVGDPARAYRVAAHFADVRHEIRQREFVTLTGTFQNEPVSVIGTGIGTDNVEIALIEAYVALHFDLSTALPLPKERAAPALRVVRVGTSGGAQPDISAGTLAVSEYALGLDTTGLYFEHPPDDDLTTELERAAQRLLDASVSPNSRFAGRFHPYAARATPWLYRALLAEATARDQQVTSGVTVTAPGFYGASSRYLAGLHNTVPDIKGALGQLAVRGRRVVNFEMESSLLFHLGSALGISCGTICPVISQPGSHHTVIDYAPRIERAIEIALGALRSPGG